jgi:hypothetical protein
MKSLALLASLALFGLGFATEVLALPRTAPPPCPSAVALECAWYKGTYKVTAVNKALSAEGNPPTVAPGISCATAVDTLLTSGWLYLAEPVSSAFGFQTHLFTRCETPGF